jgi:hypothetical protein
MGGQFDQKPLAEAIMGRGQKKNFHDRFAFGSMLIGSLRDTQRMPERRIASGLPAHSRTASRAAPQRLLF